LTTIKALSLNISECKRFFLINKLIIVIGCQSFGLGFDDIHRYCLFTVRIIIVGAENKKKQEKTWQSIVYSENCCNFAPLFSTTFINQLIFSNL
jgi:hypothetical protein